MASKGMAAAAASPSQNTTTRKIPRDAAVVMNVLRSMGVKEWEPRVVNQLMEFVHRYTSEVLEEAFFYTEHAGRTEVNLDDVKLAIEAKLQTQYTKPPTAEHMHEHAASLNRIPLPPLNNRPGIHMPQDENLLNANYQFFPRGYEVGEEGIRRGQQSDDDDDGGGRVVGGSGSGGGGGTGGDTEMKDAPTEPTAIDATRAGEVGFKLQGKKK